MKRRDFCRWMGIGMLAGYFPLALAACSDQSDDPTGTLRDRNSPASEASPEKLVTVGTTAQLKTDGYLLDEKSKVLVVEKDDQLLAVNPVCTHRGCLVDLDKESMILTCPCHQAKFGLEGEVLAEPATEPLLTYEVKQENGEVLVKLA